jgi:transcriptional regulator with XRE-family HTH domain
VAEWLEERRREEHLTQKEMGRCLGVSQPFYNQIVRGRYRPTARIFGAAFGRWPERRLEITEMLTREFALA